MTIDVNNEMLDRTADSIESGLAALGHGIAWAGFWIGLGIAARYIF